MAGNMVAEMSEKPSNLPLPPLWAPRLGQWAPAGTSHSFSATAVRPFLTGKNGKFIGSSPGIKWLQAQLQNYLQRLEVWLKGRMSD
jgi:hypothetical protein